MMIDNDVKKSVSKIEDVIQRIEKELSRFGCSNVNLEHSLELLCSLEEMKSEQSNNKEQDCRSVVDRLNKIYSALSASNSRYERLVNHMNEVV